METCGHVDQHGEHDPLRLGHGIRLNMPKTYENIMFKHVRCNPDVAPCLNSDKLLLLLQSTYLPEGVPDFYPLLR